MEEDKTIEFDFLDAVELISDVIEEGNSKEVSARVLNGTIATEAIRGIGHTFDLTDTESAFFAVIFYLQLEWSFYISGAYSNYSWNIFC